MDKCLRIVLCLSFVLFSEQQPITPKPCRSLHLKELKEEVTCDSNLTFASPIYQKNCVAAAKRTFEAGLERAIKMNCTDDNERLKDTLRAFRPCEIQNQMNSVECSLEQKTFKEFVAALEKFIQQKNNDQNKN